MTVIDYFSEHDAAFYKCVAAEGISGIARYLTNSMADARELTVEEVANAHDAGLAIHFAYEMSSTYPAYFTFAQGAEDCRQAIDRLQTLGAPQGTVVYFAVDTNIDPALCDEYFNGIESMQTPAIVPGVYGYQRMCEHARMSYPNVGKHLWQTYGTKTGYLDLWQNLQDVLCGVEVDFNECTVEGWKDMVSKEEFAAYQDDVRNSFTAVKEVLVSLASGAARNDADDAALAQQIKDTEVKAVVEAILSVKPEALKPAP